MLELATLLDAPVASLVADGYLRNSGDGYAVALRYEAGMLSVNERVLPLMPLLQ